MVLPVQQTSHLLDMKHLIIVLLLTGCATAKPELPEGAEASAPAVGSVALWRWIGKAALQLISNTTVKIELKEEGK